MIVFRGTAKALKEVGLRAGDLSDPGEGALGSWFVNVFRLERRKAALVTNDRTRYSVLLGGLRKNDFARFDEVFVRGLVANLQHDGLPGEKVAALAMACRPAAWGRTNSRSILGTVRDHIGITKHLAGVEGLTIEELILDRNNRMNSTPILVMDPCYAKDAMREALANWQP